MQFAVHENMAVELDQPSGNAFSREPFPFYLISTVGAGTREKDSNDITARYGHNRQIARHCLLDDVREGIHEPNFLLGGGTVLLN